jgi:hypothetical protein
MWGAARTVIAALVLGSLVPSTSRAVCPGVAAGSCWVVDGGVVRAGSSASAYGHSVRCSLRCRVAGGAEIVLRDDGTYSMPPSTARLECRSGIAIAVPDEEGRIREKRDRLILEPSNLPALDEFLDACAGRDVVVRRYRTTLRLAEDGTTLSGVAKLRAVATGKIPVSTRAIERFTATRVPTAARASPAAPRRRELPTCSTDLRPRCVSD